MNFMKLTLIAAATGFAVWTAPASVQAADTFVLDKPHTQIRFSVDRGGWSNVGGIFKSFDGKVVFDQDDVSKSSVEATIDTGSIDTSFEARDKHLRSPDFFNAQEFPKMTFKSTKIVKTGENTGTMTGDLTLLGVTKPVTLDVKFNRIAEHPRNKKTFAGFTATGTLNRSDYGMNFILNAVSDEVKITIDALTLIP